MSIILDATTKSLQFKLGGAITTNQLPFYSSYVDTTTTANTPGEQDGASNSTTAVTLVGVPGSSTQRLIKSVSITNADTVAATVTIIYNDNSTLRNSPVVTLAVGDNLIYEDSVGWYVMDTNGNMKLITGTVTVPNGGTGVTSLTSNAILKGNGTGAVTASGVTIDSNNALYGYTNLINAQTGTTYTLASTDTGKIVELNNASAITVTLPNNLPQGFACVCYQTGAGQVTFSAAAGATLRNFDSYTKTAGQWAGLSFYVTTNAGGASAVYVMQGRGA